MPDWIQTLLMVAAILAAIYLIIVIIEVIAVLALRREYLPMQRGIERAQSDVREAHKRIDQLVPFIESGAKEPPFDALYAQARELLRRASESVREAQRQLEVTTRNAIPEQPLAQSFFIVPVAQEISQRVRLRRGAKTAAVQLTAFNETFDRIGQIQTDIKAVPKKEQEALNAVRQRSVDASAAIDAEARSKLPLTAERDRLRQVNGFIAQMGSLLADSAPTEAAVVTAHDMRLRAEEQLQGLEGAMQRVAGERMALTDALAVALDDLEQHQDIIAAEAAAGMTRVRFTEAVAHLHAQHAGIKLLTDAGDYDSAKSALDAWKINFADAQSRHAQVQQARENILSIDAKAQQRITTLKQWMSETPARFDLDHTRALLQQIEDTSARLVALAPSENIDAMRAAGALDASVDDLFNHATATRHDFEQQRNEFEEIAAVVNNESVAAMATQTRNVAGELAQVNPAYWGSLAPARMHEAADALEARWQSERDQFASIKESALPMVLSPLQLMREQYNAAGALHADAVKALATVDADRQQADFDLQGDAITKMLADVEAIGRGSPSLAQASAALLARATALREALHMPAPHYKDVATGAQQLRNDAQAFIAGHNKQQQEARMSLDAMHERMVGLRARLSQLNDDARNDFAGWTAPAAQRMDVWMSRRDTLQTLPLDATQSALQEGAAIIKDAERVLDDATQMSRRLNERGDVLRTALAELNGVMSSAQAGLRAMGDMGSARWGEVMLDDARKPMIATVERMALLEQPQQRLSPEAALAAMDEAERDVQQARAHADAHLAEISSRLGTVNDRRHALAQALAVAEDAAQGDPQLQQDLRDLQAHVQQLQVRSAQAVSYAEALDALTQALQHAQRFTARVVGI